MTYLPTEFYLPNSSTSLVIAIKPTGKLNIRAASMLFYTLQKYYLDKCLVFLQGLLPRIISGPCSEVLVSLPPHKFTRPLFCNYCFIKFISVSLGCPSVAYFHTRFCERRSQVRDSKPTLLLSKANGPLMLLLR